MHRRPPLRALPLLLLTLLLTPLAGCSSAVRVEPYDGADSGPCREVAAAWPAVVAGQQPRETAVQSRGVAAWGDPPIVARCGAPVPGPTTDQCLDIDGVDWVARELESGVAFTTYGRDPAVEVLVPAAYRPEPLVMPAFTEAAQAVPQGERRCTAATAVSEGPADG